MFGEPSKTYNKIVVRYTDQSAWPKVENAYYVTCAEEKRFLWHKWTNDPNWINRYCLGREGNNFWYLLLGKHEQTFGIVLTRWESDVLNYGREVPDRKPDDEGALIVLNDQGEGVTTVFENGELKLVLKKFPEYFILETSKMLWDYQEPSE